MSAKYYVRVELRDMETDKFLGSGTCGTDGESREDLRNAAMIATTQIELPKVALLESQLDPTDEMLALLAQAKTPDINTLDDDSKTVILSKEGWLSVRQWKAQQESK